MIQVHTLEARMNTTWRQWLTRWKLNRLDLPDAFLDQAIDCNEADAKAAWELAIELLTRITTQELPDRDGDEKAALTSVYKLFDITRQLLRKHGPEAMEFTKLVLPTINGVVRPFTAKWHRKSEAGEFDDPGTCKAFRKELDDLRKFLVQFGGALAEMAEAEELNALYPPPP